MTEENKTPEEDKSFGGIMRKRRLEMNLTQRGLSIRLGVSPSMINNWEKGIGKPLPRTLSKVAVGMDLPIEMLSVAVGHRGGSSDNKKMGFRVPMGTEISIEILEEWKKILEIAGKPVKLRFLLDFKK